MIDEKNVKQFIAAVEENNGEKIDELLKAGKDINSSLKDGCTALMFAAKCNNSKMALYLIANGAKIDIRDSKKRTPLMYAIIGNAEKTVALLLNYGANKRIEDVEKYTVYNYAKEHRNLLQILDDKRISLDFLDLKTIENMLPLLRTNNKLFAKTLYILGELNYRKGYFDVAEDFWERAIRNGYKRAKRNLMLLYKYELKDKYNFGSPISTNARMTRGGNTPRGHFFRWE